MRSKEHNMVPSPSPPSSKTQVKGFQSTTNASPTTAAADAAASGGSHRSHFSQDDDSDNFYYKLTHLLDSYGLTLIFNVRETLLDLYLLYSEVTKRGGFRQVGREKKWGEVVSALKLDGSNMELSDRVEKLYAHLLYQFEQLYFYRSHSKQAAAASSTEGLLKRKWSTTASFSPIMNVQDGRSLTKICKDHSSQTTGPAFVERSVILPAVPPSNSKEKKKRDQAGPAFVEQSAILPAVPPSNSKEKKKRDQAGPAFVEQSAILPAVPPSNGKEKKKHDQAGSAFVEQSVILPAVPPSNGKEKKKHDQAGSAFVEQSVILPEAPVSNGKAPSNGKEKKKRAGIPVGSSGYHIFLKKECDRLKTCGQVPDGTSIFRIALDSWNKMSETEKLPYVEESKKNKEKLKGAMITNSKKQNTMEEKRPGECGDDCHGTLQPETDNSLVNKTAVGLAPKMTENAPNNPLFLCEFDPYYIH